MRNTSNLKKWSITEHYRLKLLAVTFPTAFILGIIGYLHYPYGEEAVAFSNAAYHAVQLFLLHAPHFGTPVPLTLEIARWLAAASTGFVLYNAALHLLHNQRMAYVLKRRKKHAVVCGLGRRGMVVVESLHASGTKLVAIDSNPDQEVIERLHALKIPLIIGDATRKETLKEAKIEFAERFFTLCSGDTINIAIALEAQNLSNKTKSARQCFIHINDTELRHAFQANYSESKDKSNEILHFIDPFEPEAISLLVEKLPLDHDGIKPHDEKQVHLVILGFGSMGKALAIKAAQVGHFANGQCAHISIIDRHAYSKRSDLLFHHPFMEDVVHFDFYEQEVLSPSTRQMIDIWSNDDDVLMSVVICFDNPSLVYDTVFNLLPIFNRPNVRVAARLNEPENLNTLLEVAKQKNYPNLAVSTFDIDASYEKIINPLQNETEIFAKNIHKAYVNMICKEYENNPDELKPKLNSVELNEWEKLPEDFRESNRQQTIHILFKLRACGFEITDGIDERPAIKSFDQEQLDALAMMEHERWVAERKVNNWKYGKISDIPNRINKNITEWDNLTDEVKGYDYNAVRQIPILLEAMGKKMVKKQKS